MVKGLKDDILIRRQLYPSLRKVLQKYGYPSGDVIQTKCVEAIYQYAGFSSETESACQIRHGRDGFQGTYPMYYLLYTMNEISKQPFHSSQYYSIIA